MYAGHVACCPLVSYAEHNKKGHQTTTFTLSAMDAASITTAVASNEQ